MRHGNFENSDDEDRITLSELPKGVLLEWLGITQFNAVKSSRKLIGLGVGLLNTLFESTNNPYNGPEYVDTRECSIRNDNFIYCFLTIYLFIRSDND